MAAFTCAKIFFLLANSKAIHVGPFCGITLNKKLDIYIKVYSEGL